jgi:DNA-binding HxlR family transcriptional regulator
MQDIEEAIYCWTDKRKEFISIIVKLQKWIRSEKFLRATCFESSHL